MFAPLDDDIIRLLPLSARHIVLDMLWYDEIVRIRDVALWIRERRSEGAEKGERRLAEPTRPLQGTALMSSPCWNRHLKYTLSALQRLHIVTSWLDRLSDSSTDETELQMNSVFQNSFRMALTGG